MAIIPLTETTETIVPPELRKKILALRRRRNWDGEDAEPITTDACRAALVFVEMARSRQPNLPLPRPAPSVMGAVSLYWSTAEEGLLVEIPSSDPSEVSFHWEGPGGRFEDGTDHRDEVLERVVSFLGTPPV